MTIDEAATRKIERIRLPTWHDRAYLKIVPMGENGYQAWAYLFDRPGQTVLGGSTPEPILAMMLDGQGYEPYTGPLDDADERGGA